MASTLSDLYQLPSPPSSPSNICISNECLSDTCPSDTCSSVSDSCPPEIFSDEIFIEQFINSEQFMYSDEEIKKIELLISAPVEYPFYNTKEEENKTDEDTALSELINSLMNDANNNNSKN